MKKLLSLLGSITMIGGTAASVAAYRTNPPVAELELDFTKFDKLQQEIETKLEATDRTEKAKTYLRGISLKYVEAKEKGELKDQKAIDKAVEELTSAIKSFDLSLGVDPTAAEITHALSLIEKDASGYIQFTAETSDKPTVSMQVFKRLWNLIEAFPTQSLGRHAIGLNDLPNETQAKEGIIGWTSGEKAQLIVINREAKKEVRVPIKFKIDIINKQPLAELIKQAIGLMVKNSTAPGHLIAALQTATTQATNVRDHESASRIEVEVAITYLQEAIKEFQMLIKHPLASIIKRAEHMIKANKNLPYQSQLEPLISESKTILEDADASWTEYQAKVEHFERIFENIFVVSNRNVIEPFTN